MELETIFLRCMASLLKNKNMKSAITVNIKASPPYEYERRLHSTMSAASSQLQLHTIPILIILNLCVMGCMPVVD
jgi:hypothetical protein